MDLNLAETIESYLKEYDKNPNSKVFAPLADSYRKLGEFNHALVVAKNGISTHKNFSGGHVVLGRIYQDMGQNIKSIESLSKATRLDANNILAHKLLAELYLEEQQVKKALASYKMVLFLKPTDKVALARIKKLESLTADEFDTESFTVKKLNYKNKSTDVKSNDKLLERSLSLADAFLVRNEVNKCFDTLNEARLNLGEHPEILKRLRLIDKNIESSAARTDAHSLANRDSVYLNENINHLQKLLTQINTRKKS